MINIEYQKITDFAPEFRCKYLPQLRDLARITSGDHGTMADNNTGLAWTHTGVATPCLMLPLTADIETLDVACSQQQRAGQWPLCRQWRSQQVAGKH